MIPKGKLIAVGGAEDKGTDLEAGIIKRSHLNFFEIGILKTITKLLEDTNDRIEVITTASSIPDEVGENYIDAFTKLGCTNAGHLKIRHREDALKPDAVARVQNCKAVMFSGGNQLRLSSIFGGTEFLDVLHERYINENFLIAGTSAGAMAMSNTMIYEGNATNAHLKGEVKITTGLGFLNGVIIDSHFNKRGRFPRLAQAVAANPGAIGIGLGEDTGIIVTKGEELHAIGSGAVMILDGRNIGYNNIADIEFDEPISVENLIVHILGKGNAYNIRTRKYSGADVVVKPAE
ncbi:MAG: cyanophycinase [Chitinophagales bacterium]|nr:cyanophycinase [Chitinophagales bacterium]